MQGSIRLQVEKHSEVHPAIALIQYGVSMLRPENQMPEKQFDILMRNAAVGGGEDLPFYHLGADCGVPDSE